MDQDERDRLVRMDVRLGNLEEAVEESREVLDRIDSSIRGTNGTPGHSERIRTLEGKQRQMFAGLGIIGTGVLGLGFSWVRSKLGF